MRLDRLTVKGLLRFESTIDIDFTSLPAGVIAIVGHNGHGKTSLLEASIAALYRRLPTRDRELADYALGRDSFIEARYDVQGRPVTARVNIDGAKRASDAVLRDELEILNDGKVSTFDTAVAKVFPPLPVLLASAFASQNRAGSFATLDRKSRKALFSELLNLDHLEAMAQTARTAAGLIEQGRGVLNFQAGHLQRQTADGVRDALLATLEQTSAQHRIAQADLAWSTGRIAALEAEQAERQDEATRAAGLAERTRALTHAIADVSTKRAAATHRLEQITADADVTGRRIAQEHDTAIADIAGRESNNRQLIEGAAAIRKACDDVEMFDGAIASYGAKISQAEEVLAKAQARHRDAQRAVDEQTRLSEELERLRQASAMRADVPCRGAGEFSACKFLTQATVAAARIPIVESALAAGGHVDRELEAAVVSVRLNQTTLSTLRETRDAAIASRAHLKPVADKRPRLEAAEARIQELARQRQDADARLEAGRIALAQLTDQRLAECRDEQARLVEQQRSLEALRETAQNQLEPLADAQQKASESAKALALARATRDESTRASALAESGLQELTRRLSDLNAADAQLRDVEARLVTLDQELVDWQLLAKALGRDGLPVLEIDAAGPTVSAICNDLLTASFGPRFTVELVTQEAKAGGKGLKETFELKVFDNQHGGDARDLSDLSGGEQVLVDEALKNAIAVFLNQRNQTPIRTLWRDECTAPLDADNALRYMAMLRRVREIGGFHQAIVVTHNAEAAALADVQLHVVDGTVRVVEPPFGRSEAA